MAFDKKGLDDYVDVATRIAEFRARYPSGYLAPLSEVEPYRIEQVPGGISEEGELVKRTFVVVVAAAYDRKYATPILAGGLAAAVLLYVQYAHAKRAGLANGGPPTERY